MVCGSSLLPVSELDPQGEQGGDAVDRIITIRRPGDSRLQHHVRVDSPAVERGVGRGAGKSVVEHAVHRIVDGEAQPRGDRRDVPSASWSSPGRSSSADGHGVDGPPIRDGRRTRRATTSHRRASRSPPTRRVASPRGRGGRPVVRADGRAPRLPNRSRPRPGRRFEKASIAELLSGPNGHGRSRHDGSEFKEWRRAISSGPKSG